MDSACLSSAEELPSLHGGAPRQCIVHPLSGCVPHAVFYDVTHDNETPLSKRTAEDALSTGALVTFTKAALGSNKGFDDLYPKLLDLVTDSRPYEVQGSVGKEGDAGIGKIKRVLNHLHVEMMEGGFVEGHVHEEGEVSCVDLGCLYRQYDRSPADRDPSTSSSTECTLLRTRDTCLLRIRHSRASLVEDGVSSSAALSYARHIVGIRETDNIQSNPSSCPEQKLHTFSERASRHISINGRMTPNSTMVFPRN